jgi:hypothetical protein
MSIPYATPGGEVKGHRFLSLNAVLQPDSNDEAWATLIDALSVFHREVQSLAGYSATLFGECEGYVTGDKAPPHKDTLGFQRWTERMRDTWKALGDTICSTGVDRTVLRHMLLEDRIPNGELLLQWAPGMLDKTAASYEYDVKAAGEHRKGVEDALVGWRDENHTKRDAGRDSKDPEYASRLGLINSTASQLASHLQEMASKYDIKLLAIEDTEEESGNLTPDHPSDAEESDSRAPLTGTQRGQQLEDRTSVPPRQTYPTQPVPSQKVLDDVLQSVPLLAKMLTLSDKHLRGLAVRWAFAAKAAKRSTKENSRATGPTQSSGAGPSSSLT